MNIFSFQFEDFFHHFSWGRTSGDELHQGLLCLGQFLFLFNFRKTTFLERGLLAGRFFSPSTLSISMEGGQIADGGGRTDEASVFQPWCAVAALCRWFKSELSSPGQIFRWFLLSWYMCLMSFKIPPKLSVVFFCEFSFSFIFGCTGSLPLQCLGFSVWWLLLMLSVGSRVLASVAVEHGLVAPWHAGSSLTRNGTPSPFICRWTPKHWDTREVPKFTNIIFKSKTKNIV